MNLKLSSLFVALCLCASRLFGQAHLDPTFNPTPGANGMVEDILTLPDGKVLISGAFTEVNNAARNFIAQMNADGSLDESFVANANDWIRCIARQPDGKILIGGKFTGVNGVGRNRIARLNSDGTLDATFDPGSGVEGAFYPTVPSDVPFVWGIAVQADGKILICGGFLSYDGVPRSCVARLNTDGTIDPTFNPGAGAYKWVKSIYALPDGKIMLAGWFENYDNQPYPRVCRLLNDGRLDTTFARIKWGPGASAYRLAFQPDGKIIACGHFSFVNDSAHEKVVRFNTDGTVDQTFNASANDFVEDISVRPDGKILIGGYFSLVNGANQTRLALLGNDGSLDPSLKLNINNYILRLQPSGTNQVFVGGGFSTINGTNILRIARLNMSTNLPVPDPDPVVVSNVFFFAKTTGEVGASQTVSNLNPITLFTGPTVRQKWAVAGVNDFNDDGESDFLWFHKTSGAVVLSLEETNIVQTPIQIPPGKRAGWRFVGTGDFDTNGSPDLVWQKPRRHIELWFMDGTNLISTMTLTNIAAPKAGWKSVAIADFNADQSPDIVWQRGNNLAIWLMSGTNLMTNAVITHNTKQLQRWQGVGAGDVNGDEKPDLIFQRSGGWLTALFVDELVSTNSATFRSNPRAKWKFIGVGPQP